MPAKKQTFKKTVHPQAKKGAIEKKIGSSIVYVRMIRRTVMRPDTIIRLQDVANLVAEKELEQKLLPLPLHQITRKDGNLLMLDMLQIIQVIQKVAPHVVVETFGEPHVLIEVSPAGAIKPRVTLVVLVWLLLFFGSGMAMINFHADINMPLVQKRIMTLITGSQKVHPWMFQIPYSFGVGLGMLLFFNRLFKKKRINDEPNPLEVEMFMYQENVNHYVITEEYKQKHNQEDELPHV